MFDSFSRYDEQNINRKVNGEFDPSPAGLGSFDPHCWAPPGMVSKDTSRGMVSLGTLEIYKEPSSNQSDYLQYEPFKRFFDPGSDNNNNSNNRFISESVSEELEHNLGKVDVTKATAERVRHEINVYGQSPEKAIIELMANNRVLAVGESHQTPNAQRDLVAEQMSALKKAGATHLAVEIPTSTQAILDQFSRTGQLDVESLPNMLQDGAYLKLLRAARDNGIKIVAVDRSDAPDSSSGTAQSDAKAEPMLTRDQTMADNIEKILDQDPGNKVIFFVGARHLNRSHVPESRLALDLLRTRYDAASIKPVYANSRGEFLYPLPEITAGLKQSVAVSTQRAITLGSLPDSKFNEQNREFARDWDYSFIYP